MKGNSSFFSAESAQPLYIRVENDIRKRILSKEWKSGERLPSEGELCSFYNVSRVTIRNAIEKLQNDGYLIKYQGKGTFINEIQMEQRLSKFYTFGDEIRAKGLSEVAKILSFERINADAKLAEALMLNVGEAVYCIQRVRFVENKPYTLEYSYIPLKYAPALNADMIQEFGLYKSLNNLGIFLSSAKEQFSAKLADAHTAQLLNLPEISAIISLKRTTFSGSNIIEYCKSSVRGDFFNYTVELK